MRKNGELSYLRPDGKTQVTIAYDGDRGLLDAVVVSSQHAEDISPRACSSPTCGRTSSTRCSPSSPTPAPELHTDDYRAYINPTGKFVIGAAPGPQEDSF